MLIYQVWGGQVLEANDRFGSAVSLSGSQLAVGAWGDAGAGNIAPNSGAVYLFNNPFTTPTLSGIIGKGYTGTGNYNLSALEANDYFGTSVSLSGTQLAVGAVGDDGAGNAVSISGAVYLFNNTSSTPTLSGVIGNGYTGVGSYNLSALASSDDFGYSVSLSGTQLAVGARGDDGASNGVTDAGAVYLFNNPFSTPSLSGVIGHGYTGTGNYNLAALDAGDLFGSAVSLSGTQLAVGAYFDDGASNATTDSGAVYLFNTPFSTPSLSGVIGKGYIGAGYYNLAALEGADNFGKSLSLSGTQLAVGAWGDDGAGNVATNSGAVYLFNNPFSAPALSGTIGKGYTGAGNYDLTALEANDNFGFAVSLSGTQLAVGAYGDSGSGNAASLSGAVYLLTLTPALGNDSASGQTFSANPGLDSSISPASITTILNTGSSLTLQASNDITVSNAITANNLSGSGGALTMQAGRSILVNANITTDNGNLTLIANDTLANGVVDAYRDAGAAVITITSSAAINAGSGTVSLDMRDGAGKTYSTSGATTLAGSITSGALTFGGGNLNLTTGASITGSTITATDASYVSLGANQSGTLSGVTLNGNLTQESATQLTITNGLVLNSTLKMRAGSSNANTHLAFSGTGEQSLTGTGSIINEYNNGGFSGTTYVTPIGGASLRIGSGISIMSSARNMTVGDASLGLVNEGTLQADALTLTVTGSNWSNTGTLKSNGGTLSLNGTISTLGTVTNTSGTINLAGTLTNTGKTVTLDGGMNISGTVTGGTLAVTGTANSRYYGAGGTLNGVTLAGDLWVGSGLSLLNGLTLSSSTLRINQGGGRLNWNGTQTIGGTGYIDFDATGSTAYITGWTGGSTMTFGSSITVRVVSGSAIIDGFTDYINQGTIVSGVAGQTIYLVPRGTLTNTGTLRAANGGILKLQDTNSCCNLGTINQGVIEIGTGSLAHTQSSSFTNSAQGRIAGAGTLDLGSGTLTNNGTIAPGIATGDKTDTLTISAASVNLTGGTLEIDIEGKADKQFDKLVINGTGNLTLSGTLTANLLPGYTPATGDVLSFLTRTGTTTGTSFTNTTSLPTNFNPGYHLAFGEAARFIYAPAQINIFTNTTGGLNWENTANWSKNVLPGNTDEALISSGYTVSHGVDDHTIGALSIGSTDTLNLTGGSLTVLGASNVSGVLTLNGGTLYQNGNASLATLNLTSGTLGGTGSVAVTNSFTRSTGSFANTLTGLSITQASGNLNSGAISINGPISLTANAGDIIAASNLASNGALTLKASGNITSSAAITSQNQAVVIHSDSDANGSGAIWLQAGSSISTNGGHLWLGGGSGTTPWHGLAVGDGYAVGNNASEIDAAGIKVLGDISTGAGNVVLRGRSAWGPGIQFGGGTLSSNGTVLIEGITSGTQIGGSAGVAFSGDGTRLTTATGTVSINGTVATPTSGNGSAAYGIMMHAGAPVLETTGAGSLTLNGVQTNAQSYYNIGIGIHNGTIRSTAATGGGAINLNGSSVGDTGILIRSDQGPIAISSLSGAINISSSNGPYVGFEIGHDNYASVINAGSGALTITADNMTLGATAQIGGTGTLTIKPYTAGTSVGIGNGSSGTLNLINSEWGTFADGFSSITVGSATTGNINVTALGYKDPLTLYAGYTNANIGLTGTISDTGGGTLTIRANGGTVTDFGTGQITAGSLRLLGSGTFSLTNAANNAGTLAANVTGAVTYKDADGFTIGSMTSLDGTGITSTSGANVSGAFDVATAANSISATQGVSAGTFTLSGGTWSQIATSLPTFTATDFRITGGTFIRAKVGDGGTANPYQLTDIYGVQGMGSAGMLGKSYVLANDIDASGTTYWNSGAGFVPIGNASNHFVGTFDAMEFGITNFIINRLSSANLGLFGVIGATGSAVNLVIENANVTGAGLYNVGGIAGTNLGTITNVSFSGHVTSPGTSDVGGLVGINNGTIFNSRSMATVSSAGSTGNVGGLVGYNNSTGSISGSYSTGGLAG